MGLECLSAPLPPLLAKSEMTHLVIPTERGESPSAQTNASLSPLFRMTCNRKAHLIQGTLAPNHREGLHPSGSRDSVTCNRMFWVMLSGLSLGGAPEVQFRLGGAKTQGASLCLPRSQSASQSAQQLAHRSHGTGVPRFLCTA